MNAGLVVLGVVILIGTFFLTQVMITPQQRQQIELANQLCGANIFGIPVGQIGQAASPDVANKCQEASNISQVMDMAPFGYIIGFVLLVAGLAIGGKKGSKSSSGHALKETKEEEHKCEVCGKAYATLKEASRCEARHELERKKAEPKSESKKKSEAPKRMFCKKCGTKIKEGVKFCAKCGNKVTSQ